MAVIQSIVDLVEILRQHGLRDVVVSPGSRSAAITLAFARNPFIRTTVSIDERAAGFIALGMAMEQKRPVALVCTSGTAAYNFAPAVAEAYFLQIPLIVITADRPPEWIHQQDGQTIYQDGIFGRHVKISRQFPAETAHADSRWFANRLSNEMYVAANTSPQGPVHLNVPIREPFYPNADETFVPGEGLRIINRLASNADLDIEHWHFLEEILEQTERVLIAGGQGMASSDLTKVLSEITEEWEIPVLGDVTANLGNHPDFISLQDLILNENAGEDLRPDLLITFGQSFLSKKFKNFIRKYPPREHWHVGTDSYLIDSFQSLTLQVPVEPIRFFNKVVEDISYRQFVQHAEEKDAGYKQQWLKRELLAARAVSEEIGTGRLNDLTCMSQVIGGLSEDTIVHAGNSMPVRHLNLLRRLGVIQPVFANRGTSGIDGCVSTAIGAALATTQPVVLFVGDVSFLYDRNGFLIELVPSNLKIVVLNNGGGNIFRMIDGPRRQPELERYFETRHAHTARKTAEDAGVHYYSVDNISDLQPTLKKFLEVEGASLLEIFTDPEENRLTAERLKKVFAGLSSR